MAPPPDTAGFVYMLFSMDKRRRRFSDGVAGYKTWSLILDFFEKYLLNWWNLKTGAQLTDVQLTLIRIFDFINSILAPF